jgi:transposase
MMFGHGGPVKVFVATRPVDFRKGIDGLALAVQEMFGMDPFCGAAFVFRAKRADRIKLLLWDQTGMLLVHKRLEGGKFVWPQVRDGVMRMSSAQFAALFEGVDWRLVRPERARRPFVNRHAKLTPYRRPKLTPLATSRSGPEPTELITEWRRVRP